jgi:hypothetical protein
MGAGNSPAIAGRHGAALLRAIRARCPLYQGQSRANTWWKHYSAEEPYDANVGHGMVYTGDDGLPAALIWVHCDDFLLHGPTYEKTAAALTAFLDLTVDVGLLCHPGKLTPPAQVVKYTGLLFDTVSVPKIRIPEYKCMKALAMIDFALRHRSHLSRLGLAVVIGVLKSLTEATQARIGHTYLQSLQSTLHPKDWKGDDLPYYSFTALTQDNARELAMWRWLLNRNDGCTARGHKSGCLIPSFGDGSGTGTGGTVQYEEGAPFEMWLGTWHPRLFHFSANWKEMRTLLATLERAKAQNRTDVCGITFFYFTDSMTVYCAVTKGSSSSPGLHGMVEKIKKLEIELGCHLEVVHVPGTTIITERTDGLSRGIWVSALHPRPTQRQLLSEIFGPVPHSPQLQEWALNETGLPATTHCHYRSWSAPWIAEDVFDRLTIWYPPPEVGAQLLYFLFQCHAERPLTTAALIILPRVLQKKWSRPSRHLVEVGIYPRQMVLFAHRSLLTIPVVVLLIPFHVRHLPDPRLDAPPTTALRQYHRQQAALVRGALEALDA